MSVLLFFQCLGCLLHSWIRSRTLCASGCREAAEAWEAAFVELAEGRLQRKAAGGGLRLSFSAERSVADELARVSTVAA